MNKKIILILGLLLIVFVVGCTQPAKHDQLSSSECSSVQKVLYFYDAPKYIDFNITCFVQNDSEFIGRKIFNSGSISLTDPHQFEESDKIIFHPEIDKGWSWFNFPLLGHEYDGIIYSGCRIDYIKFEVSKRVYYADNELFIENKTCSIWDIGSGLEGLTPYEIEYRLESEMQKCWS